MNAISLGLHLNGPKCVQYDWTICKGQTAVIRVKVEMGSVSIYGGMSEMMDLRCACEYAIAELANAQEKEACDPNAASEGPQLY